MKTQRPNSRVRSTDLVPKPAKPRQRLVAVATRLFYQHGVRATGIDRIIAEAEVAKMSFYRHFPSKNHLIAEYLEGQHELWMRRLAQGVTARLDQSPGPWGAEMLAEVLVAWFEEPDFQGCPFINALAESMVEDERVREVVLRHHRELEAFVTDFLIRLGYAAPRQAALSVLVILHGSIVQARLGADSVAAGEACASLLRRFSRLARRTEDSGRPEEPMQLLLAI